MATWVLTGLLVVAVVAVLATIGAIIAWRRFGGAKLARQARFLVGEEMAPSGPHQAVVRWRRALGETVDQTRESFAVARRCGAPTADLGSLLASLERAVTALDHEFALLSREPDPAVVDRALRTGLGRRADQALQIAGQLRRGISQSVSSGNAAAMDELASSADLSTRALSEALDELARRDRW